MLGKCIVDPLGRWAIAKVKISGAWTTFVSCYGPNLDDPAPLYTLLLHLTEANDYIILGGDFNLALDPSQDSTSRRVASNTQKMRVALRQTNVRHRVSRYLERDGQ